MKECWLIEEKGGDGKWYSGTDEVHEFKEYCSHALELIEKEYPNCQYRMRKYIPEKPIKKLICELYQVLGTLDAPEDVMGQVSAAIAGKKLPNKTLLPFQIDNKNEDIDKTKFDLRPGNEFLIQTLSKPLSVTIEPPEEEDYTYLGKASPLVKPKMFINDHDAQALLEGCLKAVRELEHLKVEHNHLLKEFRDDKKKPL